MSPYAESMLVGLVVVALGLLLWFDGWLKGRKARDE